MRYSRQQKGFVLIIIIILLPLLGVASVVLVSNSRLILTNTRRAALKTHAQLACESGIEWLKKNRNAVVKEQPVILEIDHKSKIITCRLELVSKVESQSVFNVMASAEDKRFSYQYSQQFIMK